MSLRAASRQPPCWLRCEGRAARLRRAPAAPTGQRPPVAGEVSVPTPPSRCESRRRFGPSWPVASAVALTSVRFLPDFNLARFGCLESVTF